MKKLLAFVLGCGMVFSSVSAIAQDGYIEGIFKNNTLTVTHTEGDMDIATVMVYDEGKLCGTKTARLKDGAYTFDMTENDKNMRIFFYGDKAYDLEVVTPTPEPTPTPQPVKTPYPEAYEKPIDAINAPAVVSDVQTVLVDGELYYELTVWHQGRELITNVREKVLIASAPSDMADLVGCRTESLIAGDVVHLTSDLQGRVKSIEFIYRPTFEDYFPEGISLDNAIGGDGWSEFVFGVAVESYADAIEIINGDGDMLTLDVSPDAFVYNVSYSRKGAVTDLYGKGPKAVPRVRIPDERFEDMAQLWNGMEEMPYVLARVSRDVVTDIIVFD